MIFEKVAKRFWRQREKAGGTWNGSNDIQTDEPDFGLHTIVPRDRELVNFVDIVAIHGLNGHYLKTWTDEKTGVNWLSDLIPRIIKNARVMSFWYNSKVQFSKSKSGILEFADQLLGSLIASREGYVEEQRPIIFLCHSLGGLVFKQATLKAQESDEYSTLRPYFSGVVFFGTPHRGSILAPWATILGRIIEATSSDKSTNTQLTRDVEPPSMLLEYISSSFRKQCKNLPIISCFETERMEPLNRLVVEKESATLLVAGEVCIPLDADHKNMCKFSTENSARFQTVRSRLENLTISCMVNSPSRVRAVFIQALAVTDYAAHRARIPEPVPGTCTWILKHRLYREWFESQESSLLWISADPGCGKSVLASFLVDHLSEKSSQNQFNLCYFFFKSDNLEQSNIEYVLKTLLKQLYSQQEELAATGQSLLQGDAMDDVRKLWQAFIMSTEREISKTTICILDGLDECHEDSRKQFLALVSAYFKRGFRSRPSHQSSQLAGKAGRKPSDNDSVFKMLVASRPENQIKTSLETSTHQKGREQSKAPWAIIRLRGEDETDAISDDVSKVVDAKIEIMTRQGLPMDILEQFQAELIARADRTFLWVSLILELLELKVLTGASRRELDELLRNKDIYKIYGELLSANKNQSGARKLLRIILGATRPLTIEEVSVALATPVEGDQAKGKHITFDDIEYDINWPFENHIRSLCGNFLLIIRNRVYFVHETAREFLLGGTSIVRGTIPRAPLSMKLLIQSLSRWEKIEEPLKFQHGFNMDDCNMILLGICTTYLYCLGRRSKSAQMGQPSGNAPFFLHYAAKSWVKHYHVALSTGAKLNTNYYQNLCHPLFPGFKTWIEEYWAPGGRGDPTGIGTDDTQDFYILHFGLGEGNSDSDDDDGSSSRARRDKRAWELDEEIYLPRPTSWRRSVAYSTNPESQAIHNFPLKVDDGGMVSLDFSNVQEEASKKNSVDF